MRTTIRLDDQLLADAKALAAQTGQTLSSVIADGLREVLARSAKKSKQQRVKLPRVSGNGLQGGVNIDSNAELLDLMERDHAPR